MIFMSNIVPPSLGVRFRQSQIEAHVESKNMGMGTIYIAERYSAPGFSSCLLRFLRYALVFYFVICRCVHSEYCMAVPDCHTAKCDWKATVRLCQAGPPYTRTTGYQVEASPTFSGHVRVNQWSDFFWRGPIFSGHRSWKVWWWFCIDYAESMTQVFRCL